VSTPTKVHLVDASPYIFRAYFSLPTSMVDPEGRPVNAVYGFAGFLLRLIAEEQPSHLALAFDGSLTTSFRNDFYPPYKAQRELPPAELEAQLDACRELGEAFGATTFIDDRYEADDIIATLCGPLRADGCEVVVVTSDKDLCQLVADGVTLYDFGKGTRFTPAEVVEKFGVHPEQIADYLGLAGDSVDNIPGVRGVGAKTAAALLSHFESIEEIYQRLDEVAGLAVRGAKSLAGKLKEHRELAELSKRLATVAFDAPVIATLAELALRGADPAKVDRLFARLGFENLRDRIESWSESGGG
jgi:5'-3' exonuclease